MAVITIPSQSVYTDLYALSGLTFGKSLIITNGTSTPLFVNQALIAPVDSSDEFPVTTNQTIVIHGKLEPIWIRGGTGPVIVQELASTIMPLTGIEFPHDVYTNNVEGRRRHKASSEPSIAAAIFNGFGYTISGSLSVANGDYLAMNISPASDIILHKIRLCLS